MLSIRKFAIGIALIGAALLAGVALVGEIRLREPADPLASLQRALDAERARADRLQDELKATQDAVAAAAAAKVVSDGPAAESESEWSDADALAVLAGDKQGNGDAAVERLKRGADRAIVSRAVDILMNVSDPYFTWQFRALDLIGTYGLTEKIPAVIPLLATDNEDIQGWAAWTLGKLGDPRAVPALASAYAAGPLPFKRVAAEALRELGRPEVMQDFVAVAGRQLLADADGEMRYEAIGELEELMDPATVPLLAQALADSNSRVRSRAVEALGWIADASALPYVESMRNDPVAAVREAARQSIVWIKYPQYRFGNGNGISWSRNVRTFLDEDEPANP
jgi:hypothetical protein